MFREKIDIKLGFVNQALGSALFICEDILAISSVQGPYEKKNINEEDVVLKIVDYDLNRRKCEYYKRIIKFILSNIILLNDTEMLNNKYLVYNLSFCCNTKNEENKRLELMAGIVSVFLSTIDAGIPVKRFIDFSTTLTYEDEFYIFDHETNELIFKHGFGNVEQEDKSKILENKENIRQKVMKALEDSLLINI